MKSRTRVLVTPRFIFSLLERDAGPARAGYVEPAVYLTLLLRGRNRTSVRGGEVVEVHGPAAARPQGAILDIEALTEGAELCVIPRAVADLEHVYVSRANAERLVAAELGLAFDISHEKEI